MKLGILPILKGIFMNLIFSDGAIKQMCSGNPLHKRIARKKYKLWLIYLYHLDLTLLTVLFLSVFLHPLHP